jgi:DNA polymerase III subunit epsilon
MRYLAIDFETANAKRTSICAFGFALFENGSLLESGVELCKPEPNYYDYWNTRIHGITFDDTCHLPDFSGQMAKFAYYQPDFLVAHNASFDMSCLRQWCNLASLEYPNYPYVCTLITSKILHPGHPSHTLDAMCRLYQVPLNHHEAGSDAAGCGYLFAEANKKIQAADLHEFCTRLNIEPGCLKGDCYQPCRCHGHSIRRSPR